MNASALPFAGVSRRAELFGDTNGVDLPRLERAIRDILIAVGEDPDRAALARTPGRAARAYVQLFRGLHELPAEHLLRGFADNHDDDDVLIVRDIEFVGLCEERLMPVMGRAHIGYWPSRRGVAAPSQLSLAVNALARRPQSLEVLTERIADALEHHLEAKGVTVLVEAEPLCAKVMGAAGSSSLVVTSAFRGAFRDDRAQGSDVLNLILYCRRHVAGGPSVLLSQRSLP